ncbi:hypothetical protein [Arundinibacter roseus]|uniref:SGNH/GDSL hydrolase family protein n=1 Tax=Arundinibacter roseus TaxID=2070510 RepID=A0A4R4KEI6_9BACT|nr:hypothetical protein [Arundinibacter roseus]TDB65262.1 hypothetical protein EZE20_11195 [Arundinibacter roseus]
MLKKSLLTALLLLIGYEVLMRSVDAWWSTGQNAPQSSVVRAHNFIYSPQTYDHIMVGSSIGNRITSKVPADSLPDSFYNLSFGGQSIFDGLLILQNMDYKPKVLFIEMNVLMRNADPELQASLFSPIMYPVKRVMHSWRERNQPLGVLARLPLAFDGNPDLQPAGVITGLERSEDAYKTMLGVQMENQQNAYPENYVTDQITKLKPFVEYFQNIGTTVVFFEVPVDPKICELAAPVQLRTKIKEAFLPLNCKFIDMPACDDYLTTDGTHLEKISVYKYLQYFRSEAKRQNIL